MVRRTEGPRGMASLGQTGGAGSCGLFPSTVALILSPWNKEKFNLGLHSLRNVENIIMKAEEWVCPWLSSETPNGTTKSMPPACFSDTCLSGWCYLSGNRTHEARPDVSVPPRHSLYTGLLPVDSGNWDLSERPPTQHVCTQTQYTHAPQTKGLILS